jgi:tetratricopeptide (TPR) repeat protein
MEWQQLVAEGRRAADSGDYRAAKELFQAAVESAGHAHGRDSSSVVEPLVYLAMTLAYEATSSCRLDDAAPDAETLRQVRAYEQRALNGLREGPDREARLAWINDKMASALRRLRALAEARVRAEKCYAFHRVHGTIAKRSQHACRVAELLVELQQPENSLVYFDCAIRDAQRDECGSHSEMLLLTACAGKGRALLGLARWDEAIAELERALLLAERRAQGRESRGGIVNQLRSSLANARERR